MPSAQAGLAPQGPWRSSVSAEDAHVWQFLPSHLASALVQRLDGRSLHAALAVCRGWKGSLGASVDEVTISLHDANVTRYYATLGTSVPTLLDALLRCCPHLRRLRLRLCVRATAHAAFERPSAVAAAAAAPVRTAHEACRLVLAAILQQLPRLPHLRSLALVATQQQGGVGMALGGLTALTQLTHLQLGAEHEARELQPICLALTRLEALDIGGPPPPPAAGGGGGGGGAPAAAAGARLPPWAPWAPRTHYPLGCLGSLTCLSTRLRALRLVGQPAGAAALPLLVQLTALTRLELEPPPGQPQLSVRAWQPGHLALLGRLRRLVVLTLPLPPAAASVHGPHPAAAAALATALGSLLQLQRLRLVVGGAPGDADLAVLAPLVAAPTRQLRVVELQLHGSLFTGWPSGGSHRPAPPHGAADGAPQDGGGAALTPGGVAFLDAVPEVALLLPGDADTLAPLAPLLALRSLRHVEVTRCSVLAPGVVQPLVGCAALTSLCFQEVLFTSLGDSYALLASRALPACFATMASLTTLSLHLAAGEHDAHMLTNEGALALAYGARALQRMEWVVRGLCRKTSPPPPPAVRAAQLTDSGVAALLGMRALRSLVLRTPVQLLQAVSPAMAALASRGGSCLSNVDLALWPDPWCDGGGNGNSGGGGGSGHGCLGAPMRAQRARRRFSDQHALLDLLPPSVTDLKLCLPALGDAAAAQIARRCPHLESLTLTVGGRRLRRAGLQRLAALPTLTALTLHAPGRVHAALARELEGVPRLCSGRGVEVVAATPPGAFGAEGGGGSSDDGSDDDRCC